MKTDRLVAFTLSEVLLVLSVIGVIAALTIPSLVENIADDAIKAQWKQDYASLSQATLLVMKDNSGTMKNLCAAGDTYCFKDKYKRYLNFVRDCNANSVDGVCCQTVLLSILITVILLAIQQ